MLLSLTLIAAACGGDDDDAVATTPARTHRRRGHREDIDYEAIGLWDDGPCDEAASRC